MEDVLCISVGDEDDDEADENHLLENVRSQVNEVLGQALDEILSQGRSDDEEDRSDEEEGLDRTAGPVNDSVDEDEEDGRSAGVRRTGNAHTGKRRP